jgi:hypothetical protein
MKIVFDYSVKLGKYDGNDDVFQWEIDSSDEAVEKAYTRAIMVGTDLEDVPELQPLREQAYREIEQEQIEKLRREGDDALAIQCFKESKSPFDCGYTITVSFADIEDVPDNEQIEEWVREALAAGDADLAGAIILEHFLNYSGDLLERALEIASEEGCQEFIDKNKR